MTRKQLLASAGLFAAMCLSASSPVFAQAPQRQMPVQTAPKAPPADTKPNASAAASPTNAGSGGSGAQQDSGAPATGAAPGSPAFAVTGIEVLRSTQTPVIDIVRVTGLVPSSGWSDPELVPVNAGSPSDGMLDLLLVAQPPQSSTDADGFMPVEAILPIEPGHPFKGVRVRSANNAVALRQFPGHAEAAAPTEDCSKCVGKLFLATGQSAPAGTAPDDVIKQEDLPASVVIVKPTDGIKSQLPDPNRLTLILGDDGRINDAFWD